MTRAAGDAGAGEDQDRLLYDSAPCGYVTATAEGRIVRANATLGQWLGRAADDLVGTDFADLLRHGARLMWLTHHVVRLVEQEHLEATAVDLVRSDGTSLPALVTAVVLTVSDRREMWFTIVDASERRAYERELVAARRAAESAEWRMRALQQVTEACSAAVTEVELGHAVEAVTIGLGVARSRLWTTTSGEDWTVLPEDGAVPDLPGEAAAAWLSGEAVLPVEPWEADVTAAVPFAHGDEVRGLLEVAVPATWRGHAADLNVLHTMGAVIGQALTRVRMQRRLEQMALLDQLTGLPNRRFLLDRLDAAMADAGPGQPLGLLFVDLDGFKGVNDRHGHLAGDRVLQALGNRFSRLAAATDVVARLGGDEFVVLQPGADEERTGRMADRVRASASRPIELAEGSVQLAASVGEVVIRAPFALAADQLLAAADEAMYAEKRDGRRR